MTLNKTLKKQSLINHYWEYSHIPHGHGNLCTKDLSILDTYIPKFDEKDALEFKTIIPNTTIEIKQKL